jgi:hypothetical protein
MEIELVSVQNTTGFLCASFSDPNKRLLTLYGMLQVVAPQYIGELFHKDFNFCDSRFPLFDG